MSHCSGARMRLALSKLPQGVLRESQTDKAQESLNAQSGGHKSKVSLVNKVGLEFST